MSPRRDRWMMATTLFLLVCAPVLAQQSMAGMDMTAPAKTEPAKKLPAKKKAVPLHRKSAHEAPTHDMAGMSMSPATAPSSTSLQEPADRPANDHVPPSAPSHQMPPMAPGQMTDMMQMDDQATRAMWLVDRLERTRDSDGRLATVWETDAWWGNDIDKLWLRSEGETSAQGTRDARAELLWNHAFSTFWDWKLGVRNDFGAGPARHWLAVGVRGLAPYWLDLDATFYVGPQDRAAARLEASYDLRLTRHLILTPDLELNFYSRNDPQRDVHAGLSDAQLGLRLRYEISRRFAPYLGLNWSYRHGQVASPDAPPVHDRSLLIGVRFWF